VALVVTLLLEYKITVLCTHISGVANVVADDLSHYLQECRLQLLAELYRKSSMPRDYGFPPRYMERVINRGRGIQNANKKMTYVVEIKKMIMLAEEMGCFPSNTGIIFCMFSCRPVNAQKAEIHSVCCCWREYTRGPVVMVARSSA
jgi:hypothetical protein